LGCDALVEPGIIEIEKTGISDLDQDYGIVPQASGLKSRKL
jgi:hypothetical protein